MTYRAFLQHMQSRRGRPVHLFLRNRRAVTGVVEEVDGERLQIRDGRGRRYMFHVFEIASWEDREDGNSVRGRRRKA